jgi:hypothetical protein
MIGDASGFTRPPDGAALAGTYAVDSVRVLASTRLSTVPTGIFDTMGERPLVAGPTEGATKQ